MKILITIAIAYTVLGTVFIGGIFYGGKIHCLTTVAMYGFSLLFLGQILLSVAFLLHTGGKKHDNPDKR